MTDIRGDILDEAKKCITGQRKDDYGSPEDNFCVIAELWSTYISSVCNLDIIINAKDVALMMILLKIARASNKHYKEDNFIDMAGYAACAGEIAANKNMLDRILNISSTDPWTLTFKMTNIEDTNTEGNNNE